ncbi:MAG TPA: helix-turn-helix domain-containing protein [Thermoleophilaceae bacterium]
MHTDSTHVNRKAAQSAATRDRLVEVARRLFAERGYAAVGTEEIVRDAGVTRGALYHQFTDKRDLFRAVFEAVEAEVAQRVAESALSRNDPIDQLRVGFTFWLDACAEPETQRIVLIDAPAVLGWEEWREIGERYGLGIVVAALQGAMDAGAIERQPVHALAHVVMGALDEAALYVARADDAPAARAEMESVLGRMVETMRPTSRTSRRSAPAKGLA